MHGHGESHLQGSPSAGVDIPKGSVVPSANVISRPLNARACGSVAGHPEIVMMLVLLGAVAILLLIACATVMNPALTRAAARRLDLARQDSRIQPSRHPGYDDA